MSDSHGKYHQIERVVNMYPNADALFHLGDICGDEDYLRSIFSNRVYIVKGNNDIFTELPLEELVAFGGHKIFMAHGHTLGVYHSYESLVLRTLKNKCDMVFFGHTHIPTVQRSRNVWIVNPGSLAYPRGTERKASFVMMEIDRFDEVHFTVQYL